MESEPFLDELLHLALFIAAIGFVGVGGVALLERVVGSTRPLVKRMHVVVAALVLIAFVVAERVYHVVT